ncbi:MAG: amino acid ABC transporter permease [Rhodobacteraceae bacterium]|nr:MAG: amino acid ABC transporter permease [Paracoccaceae bacterium]
MAAAPPHVAYVAERFYDDEAPPPSTVGFTAWLRENLFSSPLNSALTVISVTLLALYLPGLFQWAVTHSVWNASSLRECRAIMDASFGEGVRGACWAVINERFMQLIYGFYPSALRWRPNIAFVLLLIAMIPVLFETMRSLLWIAGGGLAIKAATTVVSLAQGDGFGPLQSPTTYFMVGALVLAYFFGGREHRRKWLILSALFPVIAYFLLWGGAFGLDRVPSSRFGGFLLTMIIGVTGIAASLPIGIALALGRRSDMVFIRSISVMFIEFIRGVPLITLLFVASTLLNYFLPPGTEFDLILRVLIMVTLFASAYMAEVVRGGLAALPKGQYEAADAMGLTYWQSMRLIILPQALKISIPGIVNTFIGLFKDTTLVAVIGLLDPLGLTNPIRADSNWNGIVWELYGFIGFVFFLFCWGMSQYSMFLERKLRAGDRR